MPLRGFLYFASSLQGYLAEINANIYGSKLIKIPTPRYIVFYNGTADYPDHQELNLSHAFEVPNGCMEFTAQMLNINLGHNKELMGHCKLLEEYAYFIDQIRQYQRKGYNNKSAVDAACVTCINYGAFTLLHSIICFSTFLSIYFVQSYPYNFSGFH